MEIERKWLVDGWPEPGLVPCRRQFMRQGYINVRPTVRIREEITTGVDPVIHDYILCIKSGKGIVRNEIEIPLSETQFRELEVLIGIPLIEKERRTYLLTGGLKLEVNLVDKDLPTEYWYAEIEYPDESSAMNWLPPEELRSYLGRDVSEEPGYSMGEFWEMTRLIDLKDD